MPFCAKTAEMARDAAIKDDVIQWLEQAGFSSYRDVALMSTEEKDVKVDIVEPMRSSDPPVASAKTPIGAVNIKSFWIACRAMRTADEANKCQDATAVEAPIPTPDQKSISKAWVDKHNIVLPDSMLLLDNTQGRIWRDMNCEPPRIAVWLAEKLRTKSCVNMTVGTQLALVPGRPVVTEAVIADHVEGSFELYLRARAFFHTLSLVSILTPDWFPMQSAMSASEFILSAVSASYNGRAPPIEFLVQAWAESIHYFSERIRMTKRTAAEVIDNIAGWENRWRWSPARVRAVPGWRRSRTIRTCRTN